MIDTKYIDGEKYLLHGSTRSEATASRHKDILKKAGYSVRLIKDDSMIRIYRRRL